MWNGRDSTEHRVCHGFFCATGFHIWCGVVLPQCLLTEQHPRQASGNWIYLSSDNGIYLSFSPLHCIRDPTNGWDSPMKRSQKIKLDRVVPSIKISQTTKGKMEFTPAGKIMPGFCFTEFSISWGAEKLSAVETPPQLGLNLGQHSGSCPAVTKKFFPLFSATLTLNSKRFSAQEGGKKE